MVCSVWDGADDPDSEDSRPAKGLFTSRCSTQEQYHETDYTEKGPNMHDLFAVQTRIGHAMREIGIPTLIDNQLLDGEVDFELPQDDQYDQMTGYGYWVVKSDFTVTAPWYKNALSKDPKDHKYWPIEIVVC